MALVLATAAMLSPTLRSSKSHVLSSTTSPEPGTIHDTVVEHQELIKPIMPIGPLAPGMYLLQHGGRLIPVLIVPAPNEAITYTRVVKVKVGNRDFYEMLRENPQEALREAKEKGVEVVTENVTEYVYSGHEYRLVLVYPTSYRLARTLPIAKLKRTTAIVDGREVILLSLGRPLPLLPGGSDEQVLTLDDGGVEATFVLDPEELYKAAKMAPMSAIPGKYATTNETGRKSLTSPLTMTPPQIQDWWWLDSTQQLAYLQPLAATDSHGRPIMPSPTSHMLEHYRIRPYEDIVLCNSFNTTQNTFRVFSSAILIPTENATVRVAAWLCINTPPPLCRWQSAQHPLRPYALQRNKPRVITIAETKPWWVNPQGAYYPDNTLVTACVHVKSVSPMVTIDLYQVGGGEADFHPVSPWAPSPDDNSYYVTLRAAGRAPLIPNPLAQGIIFAKSVTIPFMLAADALERPIVLKVRVYSPNVRQAAHVTVKLGDVAVCSGYTTPTRDGQAFTCDKELPPWESYSILYSSFIAGRVLPLTVTVDKPGTWLLDTSYTVIRYTAIRRSYVDPSKLGHDIGFPSAKVLSLTVFGAYPDKNGKPVSIYTGGIIANLGAEVEKALSNTWIDVSRGTPLLAQQKFKVDISSPNPISEYVAFIESSGGHDLKEYANYLSFALSVTSIALGYIPEAAAIAQLTSLASLFLSSPYSYLLVGYEKAACTPIYGYDYKIHGLRCVGEKRASFVGGMPRSTSFKINSAYRLDWRNGLELHIDYSVELGFVDAFGPFSMVFNGSTAVKSRGG